MYRSRQCDLRETILKMVVQFDVAMIIALTHDMRLKEYSVILIKSFYDINQQILRKNGYFQNFS